MINNQHFAVINAVFFIPIGKRLLPKIIIFLFVINQMRDSVISLLMIHDSIMEKRRADISKIP